jgi:hypothetical protein
MEAFTGLQDVWTCESKKKRGKLGVGLRGTYTHPAAYVENSSSNK